jgi:uncharacterized protein YdhG (YjbR/CyaY superfamily)
VATTPFDVTPTLRFGDQTGDRVRDGAHIIGGVNNDPAVDRYLQHAPLGRRRALASLRSACHEELPDFTESLAYDMPSYGRDGAVEIAFASRQRYLSLHVLRTDVMTAHRDQLAHLSLGKGCIRYRRPTDIDLDVVRSILRATAASRGEVC